MSQVPTFRPVSWPAAALHLVMLSGGIAGLHGIWGVGLPKSMVIGAGVYLAYSFGSRAWLTRHHRAGMRRVKQGEFADAISHFEASEAFFERHRWVDRWRAATMASAAKLTFHEMALVNQAFCYGQIGNAAAARALYNRTLAQYPGNVIATTALRLLDSAAVTTEA